MKQLVLVGAGHAHAHVLLEFAQRRPPGVEITLVTPVARAPYSGMVPGWMAGLYAWDECCIDFEHLCAIAGVQLLLCRATDIDLDGRSVLLGDGSRLPYDWLSLDIGSTQEPPASEDAAVLPMRPLASLRERWENLLQRVGRLEPEAHFGVAMVGGGAAGVESILAAAARLRAHAPAVRFAFTLATRDQGIAAGLGATARWLLRRRLTASGIALVPHFSAEAVTSAGVQARDRPVLEADAVLWAAGAQAWRWPQQAGLAVDHHGFIRIGRDLRSVSHPEVFASGDCAAFDPPLPKAGVYAVRMGPVLAHNLLAAVEGRGPRSYRPQRRFLVLVGTGSRHAVAAWGALAWQGSWVWRWKQRIDQRFVARHSPGRN